MKDSRVVLCLLLFIITLFLVPYSVLSQNHSGFQNLTMQKAVEYGIEKNPVLKNAALEIQLADAQKGNIIEFTPTQFDFQYGNITTPFNDKYWSVNQGVESLLTPIYKAKYLKTNVELQSLEYELAKNKLITEIKSAYYNWIYFHNRLNLLFEEKNVYRDFGHISEVQYDLGETDLLEKTTVQTKFAEVSNKYYQAQEDLTIAENKLKQLIFIKEDFVPETEELVMHSIEKPEKNDTLNSMLSYYQKNIEVWKAKTQIEKSRYFPTLSAGYFNQDIAGISGFSGWNAGFTIPLFFFNQKTKISETKIKEEIAKNEFYHNQNLIKNEIENLKITLDKHYNQINYYKKFALQQAEILIKTATLKYNKEDIEYYEYLQSISTAFEIKLNYINTIKKYNDNAVKLEYYLN